MTASGRVPVPLSRRLAFALATSDLVERAALAAPALERSLYRTALRYVAGATLPDALEVSAGLVEEGLGVSIDCFGEGVRDPAVAERAGRRYIYLARAVASLPDSVWLSTDLSHLGLDVSESLCLSHIEAIAAALPAGRRIQVGAEDADRNEAIRRIVLRAGGAGLPVMATVQANLRNSQRDALAFAEAGVPIRLVKGAFVEAAATAFPWGEETDLSFLRLAHQLRAIGAEFVIATHDPVLRESLLMAMEGLGVEMLLGVRSEDARRLVGRQVPVRVYVPFGERWFRYWARRIAESQGQR